KKKVQEKVRTKKKLKPTVKRFPSIFEKCLENPIDDFLKLVKNDSLIWHLSDLHYGNTVSFFGLLKSKCFKQSWEIFLSKVPFARKVFFKLFGKIVNPGHSIYLENEFLSLLKYIENDEQIFCITGDLTKTGDLKEVIEYVNFRNRLSEKGKVLEVPGNHDYWVGRSFVFRLFDSLFNNISRNKSTTNALKAFFDNKIFLNLETNPISWEQLQFKKKMINFLCIDSNFRHKKAISQGIFPLDKEFEIRKNTSANFDFNIVLLHHHIDDYLDDCESNSKYLKEVLAMRVVNSYKSSKLLRAINVDFVLHGHKHKQDYKHLVGDQKVGTVIASPSLFLDIYCPDERKVYHESEYIGFNIIHLLNNKLYLLQIRLIDGVYKLFKVDELGKCHCS
ncbi:metallophosphoesterase, partial [Halobacteriovorax sp. Y22]